MKHIWIASEICAKEGERNETGQNREEVDKSGRWKIIYRIGIGIWETCRVADK